MLTPKCCERTMLVAHRIPRTTMWWCVRCGSYCMQVTGDSPSDLVRPVAMQVPLAFAGRVAALLENLADNIECGRVHFVQVENLIRDLSELLLVQGADRDALLRELLS